MLSPPGSEVEGRDRPHIGDGKGREGRGKGREEGRGEKRERKGEETVNG